MSCYLSLFARALQSPSQYPFDPFKKYLLKKIYHSVFTTCNAKGTLFSPFINFRVSALLSIIITRYEVIFVSVPAFGRFCEKRAQRQEILTLLGELCEMKDLKEFLEERMIKMKKVIEEGGTDDNNQEHALLKEIKKTFFVNKKKKKKSTLQLKEPCQFDWMNKRKETLNLVIDHKKKEVIISINNKCGKSNMVEFF
ncbi:hypothetical protein RFI_09095 [Reticulomyxa filosa]|uniref:Uncharacterized protein n=1 Tax=Reticulomyxa filosa TaxID=46433 RepID=X6NRS0_RETFI|nr:hypothetical protein RFI_09095 [Reticulomyxa filosa]|eukprot:ETO28037.1 hypothetical protein RFI_09095 [Reticulomyxa filosa]